jgi:hypothetical protein
MPHSQRKELSPLYWTSTQLEKREIKRNNTWTAAIEDCPSQEIRSNRIETNGLGIMAS